MKKSNTQKDRKERKEKKDIETKVAEAEPS